MKIIINNMKKSPCKKMLNLTTQSKTKVYKYSVFNNGVFVFGIVSAISSEQAQVKLESKYIDRAGPVVVSSLDLYHQPIQEIYRG